MFNDQTKVLFSFYFFNIVFMQVEKSPFVAWFHLNQVDASAKNLTFDCIPKYFIFENKSWKWIPRVNPGNVIIRVTPISLFSVECFALRQLAMFTKGPKSFEELRTG